LVDPHRAEKFSLHWKRDAKKKDADDNTTIMMRPVRR
jgi:hypothetical protein